MTPNQARFAAALSHYTGLNPKVVGAWLLAEQSGSAAKNYEGKGYNNWLNIARTDSGDRGGAHSNVWSHPDTAAKATAEWLSGRGKIAKEYGSPAPGIRAILGTAGHNPDAQIHAIATSGWASSGYNGGSTLHQLMGQVNSHDLHVGGMEHLSQALEPTLQVKAGKPTFDTTAFRQAIGRAENSGVIASLFSGKGAGDQALSQALRLPRPNPQEYEGKEPTVPTGPPIVKGDGSFVHPSPGYVHPLPGGTITSHDMGIDISAKPGTPVRAIGDSKVLSITPNWYAGQPYVELELLHGPRKGQTYYASEQITPHVRPGQSVRAGQTIGLVAPHGTALEFGWGSKRPGVTKAQASGQRKGEIGSRGTKAGEDFYHFVGGLR